AFQQITDNMMTGMDDHRVPPKYLLEKVLVQTNTIAQQKPEDTPFARPLKKFPASISAADQQRIKAEMLDAIQKQVQPAYTRFARFLQGQYIPAGRTEFGVWSLPDGDKYYAFRVRQSTTTDLTPDQIHQIGLDEVKRDEAEMLVIAQKLGFKDLVSLRASINGGAERYQIFEAELLRNYQHLRFIALYFIKADLMNLIRRQIGCRALPDAKCIVLIAIRQRPDTELCPACRNILSLQESGEARVCRLDLFLNCIEHFGLDALLICGGNARWKFLQRPSEG